MTREEQRLQALYRTGLLDTPAEGRFDRITRLTQRHFSCAISQITLVDSERQWFKSVRGFLGDYQTPRDWSFCSRAIANGAPLIVPDTHADPEFASNPLVTGPPHIRFYAGHPIRYQNELIGTLCVIDRQSRKFEVQELEDLEALSIWVEREVAVELLSEAERELLSQIDQLRQVALLDHLTRAWNRAGLEELFAREASQAQRQGRPLSLAIVDIDFFKKVNDNWGHPAGDAVLKKVADRIRLSIRNYDALGRFGGEEFLVLMPSATLAEASVVAERIRQSVASTPLNLPDQSEIPVTISLGVTQLKVGQEGLEEAIARADLALYRSKNEGRNRVTSH